MKTALQTFEAGLIGLNEFLDSTENEARLLKLYSERIGNALNSEEQSILASIAAAHVRRKQYIYTVTIVSLYGLLERYIDSIIELHVQMLSNIANTYTGMPRAIVDSHVIRSMELVKALAEDKFRTGALTEAQVIENLHLCLSGASEFRVNGSAFSIHRGNLTLAKIGEFLKGVGIQGALRRVCVTKPMLEYLGGRYPGRDIRSIADQDLPNVFEPINSLVQRRNEVSHGVVNIDELESVSLLKERCNFIDAYVHSLHCVFLQEIARACSLSRKASVSLGRPIAVFDKKVVCFEMSSGEISVGDVLIAETGDEVEVRPVKVLDLATSLLTI
jgi:hypothetical protein